ncbi:hypothetical protein V8C42DRAFT_319849 [Trichoderma barbatum]
MPLPRGERQIHSPRRSDSCLGWHCLTSAKQFGIIFSIVVIFIILSIVWMYCMGRARILRKQTKPHNVPRRQRIRQHHRNLSSNARPVSSMVQQIPVLQYGVTQQAPVYFFSGPQVLAAQPLGVMNVHMPLHVPLPATMLQTQEAQQPKPSDDVASESSKAQEHRQRQAQPLDNESVSHHPTWWQRFYRAFNLPVGAASTVASSPSPEPSELPQAKNANANHSASHPRFESRAVQIDDLEETESLERTAKEQDEASSVLCNRDTSSDSAQSIRSDVATVRSDDYEMPPGANNQP